MKKSKRLMTLALAVVVLMTTVLMVPGSEVEAASKPRKTKITYLKSNSAGKATVKYKKVKDCKYQIQAATNSKMTSNRKTYKTSSTKKTLTLKQGRKYYVRVRTYKKIGKKTKYSKWSSMKSVTVKKTASKPAHQHTYNIPVTKQQTVRTPEPLSNATYPNGNYDSLPQWVKDEDISSVEYVAYTKEGFEFSYNEWIDYYGYASNSSMIPENTRYKNFGSDMYVFQSKDELMNAIQGDTEYKGWAECIYTEHSICRLTGAYLAEPDLEIDNSYPYALTETVQESICAGEYGCGQWTNPESLKQIIVHPSTTSTQTVTVGYKCSCGAQVAK